jgi:hypothetical protein
MTLTLLLIAIGAALIYGGWKNLSIKAMFLGNNTSRKTPTARQSS